MDPQVGQKKICIPPIINLLYGGEDRICDLCVRKGLTLVITACLLNRQVRGAQSSFSSSLLHSLDAGNPPKGGRPEQRPGRQPCIEVVFSL